MDPATITDLINLVVSEGIISDTIESTDLTTSTVSIASTNFTSNDLTVGLTLTSAQLKALRATPIVVLAAPGAGKLYLLREVVFRYNFLTAAYTGNGNIALILDNPAGATLGSAIAAATFMTGTNDLVHTMPTANVLAATDPAAIVNKAMYIANTGAAEFATGAGTVDVKIRYEIVSI